LQSLFNGIRVFRVLQRPRLSLIVYVIIITFVPFIRHTTLEVGRRGWQRKQLLSTNGGVTFTNILHFFLSLLAILYSVMTIRFQLMHGNLLVRLNGVHLLQKPMNLSTITFAHNPCLFRFGIIDRLNFNLPIHMIS